jgi:hypothetical protein
MTERGGLGSQTVLAAQTPLNRTEIGWVSGLRDHPKSRVMQVLRLGDPRAPA